MSSPFFFPGYCPDVFGEPRSEHSLSLEKKLTSKQGLNENVINTFFGRIGTFALEEFTKVNDSHKREDQNS